MVCVPSVSVLTVIFTPREAQTLGALSRILSERQKEQIEQQQLELKLSKILNLFC